MDYWAPQVQPFLPLTEEQEPVVLLKSSIRALNHGGVTPAKELVLNNANHKFE